jgi:NAD(P)H-dependent FMN reductase/ketosteroid isomerase-like protein
MSSPLEVAVLVGSLRNGSLTRKVARTDRECSGFPALHVDRHQRHFALQRRSGGQGPCVGAAAPGDRRIGRGPAGYAEYNRSIPGCLKNVLDVGSRPQGKSVWDGKPAGVVSVTPYKLGAFGANHAVRQALVYLNMPAMQQPEAYVSEAGSFFDEDGTLKNDETKRFLTTSMGAFAQWVSRFARDAQSASFDEFMKRRTVAAVAYVNGDAAPLNAMSARAGTATFFPPNGGHLSGVAEVVARYDTDAKSFSPGGVTSLEVLQKGASGGIAFWTGLRSAEAKIGGKLIPMKLRITELFRLEDGEWKLVHRYADTASEPQQKPGG